MRNSVPRETTLIELALSAVREALPHGWEVTRDSRHSRGPRRSDAALILRGPDRTTARIVVEAKARLDASTVPLVAEQLDLVGSALAQAARMVAAPYVSPATRAALARAGIGYVDATGNLRVEVTRPALFLSRQGADRNPFREGRELRSLAGPAAARVVRALCDFRPPYGVRELAERCGASAPSVSRVVRLLERDGFVVRDGRGPVTDVDWQGVLRRWAEDYRFTDAHDARSYLEPRGARALLSKLRGSDGRYAVTGSLAAGRHVAVAPPRLAAIFVGDADAAAREWGLLPADTGANVLLAEPFDDVVFERASSSGGVVYVAVSQAAADLASGPGRSPAEAVALIEWMGRHEDAWRT